MIELPVRTDLGFHRTPNCACELCSLPCKYIPGYLIPADLDRLLPSENWLHWAEEHLRASPGFMIIDPSDMHNWKRFRTGKTLRIGTLVPKRKEDASCHWLVDGRCQVHADSPFACAHFSEHQPEKEADQLRHAGFEAVLEAWASNGKYAKLWIHLAEKGLTGPEIKTYHEQFNRELDDLKAAAQKNRP